jgi:hypothetical protein
VRAAFSASDCPVRYAAQLAKRIIDKFLSTILRTPTARINSGRFLSALRRDIHNDESEAGLSKFTMDGHDSVIPHRSDFDLHHLRPSATVRGVTPWLPTIVGCVACWSQQPLRRGRRKINQFGPASPVLIYTKQEEAFLGDAGFYSRTWFVR